MAVLPDVAHASGHALSRAGACWTKSPDSARDGGGGGGGPDDGCGCRDDDDRRTSSGAWSCDATRRDAMRCDASAGGIVMRGRCAVPQPSRLDGVGRGGSGHERGGRHGTRWPDRLDRFDGRAASARIRALRSAHGRPRPCRCCIDIYLHIGMPTPTAPAGTYIATYLLAWVPACAHAMPIYTYR